MNYTLTHHQNLIQHLSFFLIFHISCVVYFINRACVRFYMKMTFEYFIGYKNKNMISIDIKMAVILLTLYPNTILIITSFKGYINIKILKTYPRRYILLKCAREITSLVAFYVQI